MSFEVFDREARFPLGRSASSSIILTRGDADAARVEGTDRYRVVCTPSGGAASVTLELPACWDESMSDEALAKEIAAAG